MILDAQSALLEAVAASELRPIQKLRIRLALRYRPAVRAEILGAVQMQLCVEGLVSEEGVVEAAIDWRVVIDTIIKYLPTILSLIMMFI